MKKNVVAGIILFSLSSFMNTVSLPISNVNNTGEIKLYFSEKPTSPYQEIALVSMYYTGEKTDKLIPEFKAEVKKYNCDAAINVTLINPPNGMTLSGIAIKFIT